MVCCHTAALSLQSCLVMLASCALTLEFTLVRIHFLVSSVEILSLLEKMSVSLKLFIHVFTVLFYGIALDPHYNSFKNVQVHMKDHINKKA